MFAFVVCARDVFVKGAFVVARVVRCVGGVCGIRARDVFDDG